MAIAKLTLRRKSAEPEEETAAPVKKSLTKKPTPVEEVEEVEEEEEAPAPKKVLMKKRLGGGPAAKVEEVEEEEETEEEEAPAPKKKVLGKKSAPVEEVEEEEVEEEAPAPTKKKILGKKPVPVEEEEEEEEEVEEEEEEAPAPKKKVLKASKAEVVDKLPKKVLKKANPVEEEDTEDKAASPSAERAIVAYSPMAMGQIDGEVTDRDISRPRLQLVQANSSDLEEKGFTVGQIVLNGEILVWEKGFDPLNVILMTGRKKFVQKLSDEEYKEGTMPLVFESATDAREAGFSTEWVDDEPPTVDAALYVLLLLEQPDYIEPDPIFSMEFGDRRFTLAEMKFSGVNYRTRGAGANWLMTQSRTSLTPDTRHFGLGMHASREKQKKSGNIVTVAQFKNLGRHEDLAFRDWVLSLG